MSSSTLDSDKKNIIVIGGGIIGSTTAYFLTRHESYSPQSHKITLLETTSIAGGASGKAGGLLAQWAYPSQIVPLSFKLHTELAKKHNGEERWGYRQLGCGQVDAKGRPLQTKQNGPNGSKSNGQGVTKSSASGDTVSLQKRDEAAVKQLHSHGFPRDLDWIVPETAVEYQSMAKPGATAQVHPYQFTTSMASLAEEAGVEIRLGAKVTSVNPGTSANSTECVESVTYIDNSTGQSHTIPATHVVLAAGPWTKRILPSAPIAGLRAHSVTIRPSRPISAYALFTSISLPANFKCSKDSGPGIARSVGPEIYARPHDEVYACGEGDTLVPLPDTTSNVEVDQTRCQDVIDYVGSISDELRDGEVTARQACYLPVIRGNAQSNGPFIGEVREMRNLIIATGHSCWGIQNAPGTAKCVGEIVMDGKVTSAKLGALDPKKGM